MAYKCLECGHIFEDGEESVWYEDHGEMMRGCPVCDGAYEEAVECEICGAAHLSEELNGGVCDECIDEYRSDFDTCYAVSMGETQKVEINALLAALFDPRDIEQILKEHIKNRMPDIDCGGFIDADRSWFGENLVKEVSKSENKKDES